MVTIVTHVELKPGAESEWDRTMHERLRAAEGRPGWVAGILLQPADKPNARVIVVEGAGHSIQGDRPLELAEILEGLL